jgi:hypothetical protein
MTDTNPKHAELVRDRGGPEDPTVRDSRKATKRPDSGDAFLPDPIAEGGHGPLPADDAEWFAEEYIASATTGEPIMEDARDEVVDEEDGGPFLELSVEPEEEIPDTIPTPTDADLVEASRDVDRESASRRNPRSRHIKRPSPL